MTKTDYIIKQIMTFYSSYVTRGARRGIASKTYRHLHQKPLATFKVERYAGWDICKDSLSSSECETYKLSDVLALASDEQRKEWENLDLGYAIQAGTPKLRQRVAERYLHHQIDVETVTIVAPQEGIYLSMLGLLKEGDHVVVANPSYQSLFSVADSIGCDVSFWTVKNDDGDKGWYFDLGELRNLIKPETKMVVCNFPNNPTGALPTQQEWLEIVELCRSNGAWLFSDEMYQGLEHGDRLPLASACDLYDKGISLGGLSKSFGLPGLRIGWIASQHPFVTAQIRELKDYTTICGSVPSEFLGIIALEHETKLVSRSRQIIASGMAELDQFIQANSDKLRWSKPKGGTFSLVELKNIQDVPQYCHDLVHNEKLLLLPASLFELPKSYVRICFGKADFPQRLQQWKQFLR